VRVCEVINSSPDRVQPSISFPTPSRVHSAGWARCGLADVLQQTDEQKVEAMSLCMSEPNQVLGVEPEVEVEVESDAEEEQEEMEGVDGEGPVEED
jgi:hypothetical protein